MNRRYLLVCVVLLLLTLGATAYVYPDLPALVPIHWNMRGEVDGYGARWSLWLTGPGLIGGIVVLRYLQPWLPRGRGTPPPPATFDHIVTVIAALAACIHLVLLAAIQGVAFDIGRVLAGLMFAMLIFVGNPIAKVRRNAYLGIRTPWTLANDKVWYATHRMGSKVLVGTGAAGLLLLTAGSPTSLLMTLIVAAAVVPIVYSLLLYKRLERAGEL